MSGDPRRPAAVVLFCETHKCLPYVEAALRRGLQPLVVGLRGSSPLAQRAIQTALDRRPPLASLAEFACHGAADAAEVCADVTRWSLQYDLQAGLLASESLVEAGALALDLVGLPSIGLRAARICRDKSLQRAVFADISPPSLHVRSEPGAGDATAPIRDRRAVEVLAAAGNVLPVVVKPTRLESSQGVRSLGSVEELDEALRRLAPGEDLLVEQRVRGPEYTVDAIVAAGRVAAIFMSAKRTNEQDGSYFVELAHTTPPQFEDFQHRLLLERTCVEVVARLGIEAGMVHGEYRITPEGQVVLMEIAGRPPGDAIVPMYSISCGRSVEDMLLDACLGLDVVLSGEFVRRVRQVYLTASAGALADVVIGEHLGVEADWVADGTGVWPVFDGPRATSHGHDKDLGTTVRAVLVLKPRLTGLTDLVDSGSRPVTAIFDVPISGDLDAAEDLVRREVAVLVDDHSLR